MLWKVVIVVVDAAFSFLRSHSLCKHALLMTFDTQQQRASDENPTRRKVEGKAKNKQRSLHNLWFSISLHNKIIIILRALSCCHSFVYSSTQRIDMSTLYIADSGNIRMITKWIMFLLAFFRASCVQKRNVKCSFHYSEMRAHIRNEKIDCILWIPNSRKAHLIARTQHNKHQRRKLFATKLCVPAKHIQSVDKLELKIRFTRTPVIHQNSTNSFWKFLSWVV